jgi:hypothetical protein
MEKLGFLIIIGKIVLNKYTTNLGSGKEKQPDVLRQDWSTESLCMVVLGEIGR